MGILDWYTVLMGVFVLVTIAAHGALFLAWKTEGAVHERCRALPKLGRSCGGAGPGGHRATAR